MLGYLLGVLSYRYVERWGLRAPMALAGNRAYGFLAGFLVVALSGGAFLVMTTGALYRYPSPQRVLYAAQFDRAPFRCSYISRLRSAGEEICNMNRKPDGDGILVLGDSHADQIKQVVADLGTLHDRPVYLTKRNCKIIDFGTSDFCSEKVWAEVSREISAHKISAILLVSYWLPTDRLDVFDNAVARASATGATIYLEQALPTGAVFDPADRLLKHVEGAKTTYTLADYAREYGAQNARLEQLVRTNQKLVLLRPTEYLCPDGICDFATNGLPNYSDTHHVTSVGAARLKPMYYRLFTRPRSGV